MTKDALRQRMKAFRGRLNPAEIAEASAQITGRILDMPEIDHDPILVYVAHRREVRTRPLIAALLARGLDVAVPHIEGKTMTARRLRSLDDLVPGDFHIETSAGEEVDARCCITPGLAFSESGGRLGFGVGHYDRFCAGKDLFCIGVCLEGQIQPVPMDAHDRHMNAVVTPDRVIRP